jgi:phage major head subunit gpT-like protein
MSVSYNPAMFTKGAKTRFMEQIAKYQSRLMAAFCSYEKSDKYSEDYPWIGEAPNLTEFVDEIAFKGMSDSTYALFNKKFIGGLEVSRDNIMDDQLGGFRMRIDEWAQISAAYDDYLICQQLINGTSTTLGAGETKLHVFDNGATEAFFADTHTARGDSGTGDNLRGGQGTSVSQIQDDVGLALADLMGFKGEHGHPVNFGVTGIAIACPVALQQKMNTALYGDIISQTSNVISKDFSITPYYTPYLDADSTADYYVGVTGSPSLGLLYQDREPVTMESQENQDSDVVFSREVYRYKVRKRARVGFGRWHRLVKVNN